MKQPFGLFDVEGGMKGYQGPVRAARILHTTDTLIKAIFDTDITFAKQFTQTNLPKKTTNANRSMTKFLPNFRIVLQK